MCHGLRNYPDAAAVADLGYAFPSLSIGIMNESRRFE